MTNKDLKESLELILDCDTRQEYIHKTILEQKRLQKELEDAKSSQVNTINNSNLETVFPFICNIKGYEYLFERENAVISYRRLADIKKIT